MKIIIFSHKIKRLIKRNIQFHNHMKPPPKGTYGEMKTLYMLNTTLLHTIWDVLVFLKLSVMCHLMFVHTCMLIFIFSSVWVAEWPPFGKSCSLG